MKSRLFAFMILVALFAAPAFADTISFTNSGLVSGSLSTGIVSTMDSLSFDGGLVSGGGGGSVMFNLGQFTGNLEHGSFSGGNFGFSLGANAGAAIFFSNFSGTLTQIGDSMYELVGTFSGTVAGIHINGTTTQFFSGHFDDDGEGEGCLRGLHGNTNLTTATVPEPGTLSLLGTGVLGLLGAARRKLLVR